MRKREKALKFVEHIERHLRKMDDEDETESRGYSLRGQRQVMCKICNKTIDEIAESDEIEKSIKTPNPKLERLST